MAKKQDPVPEGANQSALFQENKDELLAQLYEKTEAFDRLSQVFADLSKQYKSDLRALKVSQTAIMARIRLNFPGLLRELNEKRRK